MRFVQFALASALTAAPALAEEPHPLLAEGASLYKQFCSHCHGLEMVNPGTSSFDLRKFPNDDKPRFVHAVQNGKGSMPAWGDILLPPEIDAIWVYVATLAGKQPFPSAGNDAAPTVPGDRLLTGGTLTACLARNGGAMSGWRHSGGTGFDYVVLEALADHLELAFEVIWFEADQDEFADPVTEAYAMLSHPLCDIVAAHPDMPAAQGAPSQSRAALPRWTDMPATLDRPPTVDLRAIEATVPYRRVELGLVLAEDHAGEAVQALKDLSGVKVGVPQGTLGEAVLRRQAPKELMQTAVTLRPGPGFLWEMEKGLFDATLVETGAFDFHKRQNPISKLHLTDYRHALGLNITFAVLQENDALRDAVNWALEALLAEDTFTRLAEVQQITYIPPRQETGSNFRALLE